MIDQLTIPYFSAVIVNNSLERLLHIPGQNIMWHSIETNLINAN